MKIFLSSHLFFSFFFWISFIFALDPEIAGFSGVLINGKNGKILFEKNAHKLCFPASTTKIATAFFILDQFPTLCLSQEVSIASTTLQTVSERVKVTANYEKYAYCLEPDGTNIGLKPKEKLSYQALLEGMLICSGNDAANALADALGPTIPVFISHLNEFLKNQGCLNTTYYNPHGLHHPQHVTTAFDLAKMTASALQLPEFAQIVSKVRFQRPRTNLQPAMNLAQTNKLLKPGYYYYPHAIGVKTGYHSKAGKVLVAAAQKDERLLILVLTGYKDKNLIFEDAKTIFSEAFDEPLVKKTLIKRGNYSFPMSSKGKTQNLSVYLEEDFDWICYPSEDEPAECFLFWTNLELPIQKSQKVGELQLINKEGKILKKVDIKSEKRLERKWPLHWIDHLKKFWEAHFMLSILYLGVLMFSFSFLMIKIFK